MTTLRPTLLSLTLLLTGIAHAESDATAAFPFSIPAEKPDRPLSEAMHRLYDQYLATIPENHELYTNFRYTPLQGFDYHDGNGTVSRRDPSKVIKVGGKFYAGIPSAIPKLLPSASPGPPRPPTRSPRPIGT